MEEAKPVAPPEKGMADTPTPLADALVQAVGVTGAESWLDPSAGSGQLVKAALRADVPPSAILAVDLQAELGGLDRLGLESLPATDFLRWAQGTSRRFDRVIANPPFVRLRELDEVLARPALETRLNGNSITGTANYWVAFLTAGMQLLKPGGSLAYVLPAAYEYANYARALREVCESSFYELDVHRVSVPMFDQVVDGSVLLVGRGFGERPHRPARVIRHQTLTELIQAVAAPALSVHSGGLRSDVSCLPEGQIRFGEIAQVRVGAVTGDVGYFLLNEERRLALGLPLSAVRPVLSKAQHIGVSEIDNGAWAQLLSQGERVWLFYPPATDLAQPAVQTYLDLPEEEGGARRGAFKIRQRDPWYHVLIPESFDGFVTGMSESRPWVALNRKPRLTITNTLYGVRFPTVTNPEEQAAWCLSMLSSTTVESRARLVRQYPQGLLKLEPRDIASLAVRHPPPTAGARDLYRQAVDLMVAGRTDAAQAMADSWLNGHSASAR